MRLRVQHISLASWFLLELPITHIELPLLPLKISGRMLEPVYQYRWRPRGDTCPLPKGRKWHHPDVSNRYEPILEALASRLCWRFEELGGLCHSKGYGEDDVLHYACMLTHDDRTCPPFCRTRTDVLVQAMCRDADRRRFSERYCPD